MAEGSQARMEIHENEVALSNSSVANNISNGPMVSGPMDHGHQEAGVSSKSHSPPSREAYWFAQSHGGEGVHGDNVDTDDQFGSSAAAAKDREDRARLLRERQQEDRSRKLYELRSAAVQAQRFREQQEDERRRRIDEIRSRDMERRTLVEERKKQIWEVEKDRRDGILRKSQEREARVEAMRNAHRSSIGFAFGSCTPRLLELDPPSVFGGRRSTSQNNVALSAVPSSRALDIDLTERPSRAAYRHSVHEIFEWAPDDHGKWPLTEEEPKWAPGPSYPYCTLPRKGLRYESALTGSGVLVGEDPMTRSTSSVPGVLVTRRGRRRTDLIPTTPTTYRESTAGAPSPSSSFGSGGGGQRVSSAGRAFSMSRLDQLALPKRTHTLDALHETTNQKLSKTKSMSHLAYQKAGGGGGGKGRSSTVTMRKTDTSKSMGHLSSSSSSSCGSPKPKGTLRPTITPRPTRTSQLRKESQDPSKVLADRTRMLSKSMVHLARRTPDTRDDAWRAVHTSASSSSPSRPHSSLSQQSLSSHNSSSVVNVRARSTPRKPRPISVAGVVPGPADYQRQSRSVEKKPPVPSKPPRAKSAGPSQVTDALSTPLLPKPTVIPRKPSAVKKAVTAPVPAVTQPVNEKPKPPGPKPARKVPVPAKCVPQKETVPEPKPELPQTDSLFTLTKEVEVLIDDTTVTAIVAEHEELISDMVLVEPEEEERKEDIAMKYEVEEPAEEMIEDIAQPPDLVRLDSVPETDMSTSVSGNLGQAGEGAAGKQRITTEEEAKAVLAERRRLARAQAEREAELERIRQEEIMREEEERLKREEEAQRLWEEEQEAQGKLEAERLQRAIEEQRLREEDEARRRNEEAQLKAEKEEAERKAREEAEKLRKETEERLRQEEEDRAARRKKVEAIMSRTRNKGIATPPVTTPNKSIEPVVEIAAKMAEEGERKHSGDNVNGESGTGENKIAADLLDNEMSFGSENGARTNGFATHHEKYNLIMDSKSSDVKSVDDLAQFDPLFATDQVKVDSNMRLDESVAILNEDSVNSNLMSNGLGPQSVIHDNFSKQQESGVTTAAATEPFFI